MKIVYTHRTQGVGAEGAHIKGMYEAFQELGHEMRMSCLPGCDPVSRPAQGQAPKAAGASRVRVVLGILADHAPQIVFEFMELAYNAVLAFRLGALLIAFRPDLVYERYSLNTFAPSLLCRLLGIRHVLEVNDSVVIERSRPLKLTGLAAALERFCLASSDRIVTITAHFKDLLLARFRIDAARVMVLTNGVSRSRFFDRAFDRGGVRARLGLESRYVIGSTGQFLAWHGLQELVKGLGSLVESEGISFLFIGDGPARKEIMEAAESCGIGARVIFTGMLPIEAVPAHLSALDLAVIPSAAAHASPMKLIEYMAVGLPVVAPDLPSIKAALAGPGLGMLFPNGDMAAMREAVLRCLRDRESAKALGGNAKRHVLEYLTWTSHAVAVLGALP